MIDPKSVPQFSFSNGDRIPAIGLGTFGSDKYSANEVARAVYEAVRSGYRHIDCASVYRNEKEIGTSLARLFEDGISRDELWITSKVWNDRHHDATGSCEDSLADLGLDYLDLYLIHWPFRNHHGPGVGVDSRDPHATPYDHDLYMETWGQMESLVQKGLIRHIGVSNVSIAKLDRIIADAKIKPEAVELELHPHFQQSELFDYIVQQGMIPIGYSPFGSPSRPLRDRTPDDTVDLEDPVLLAIAAREEMSPAQIAIRWAIQRGQIPIPFSVKPEQYLSSLAAATCPPLSEEDMVALGAIDRNCRLIKGQVFLWKEAQGWEDLWD